MAGLDIITRGRHEERPVDRDRRLWLETQFLSADIRTHLKDVILLLAKERAGHVPYFAIDFEILHGFLFPTIQSKSSRVSPALVSYVMRQFPHKFVLPPGTMVELLRFADRCFPILSRLELLRDSQVSGSLTKAELAEAIDLYLMITGTEERLDVPVTAPEEIARRVIECAADLVSGFDRLHELLASKRIARMEEVCPGWGEAFEESEDLISAIAAKLSAVQRPSSPRTRANNRNDARNIATILTVDQMTDRLGEDARFYVQLLTETRPILHLDLGEYGRDNVAGRLVTSGELLAHFTETRFAWFASTVSSAAVYCAFRLVYGDVQHCYEQAMDHYQHLWDFQSKIFKLDREIKDLGMGKATARLQEAAYESLTERRLGDWYFPMRAALQQTVIEARTRDTIERQDDSLRLTAEADVSHRIVSPRVHGYHSVEVLTTSDCAGGVGNRGEPVLQLLNMEWQEGDQGHLFRVKERRARSRLTGEQLLFMQYWSERVLYSITWPVRLDLDGILRKLCAIAFGLGKCKSQLVASYEASPERFGVRGDVRQQSPPKHALQYRRIMFRADSARDVIPIRLSSLVISGRDQGNSDLFLLPSWLMLETNVGDLHVASPYSIQAGGPKAICNFDSQVAVDLLLKPLLRASHPLIWSSPALGELEREVTQWTAPRFVSES